MNSEDFLLFAFKKKDEKALSTLYDTYSGALYNVILKICKDESVAQDLLQETFITIWDKSDSFDPKKGRVYTWAYRIAKNKTLNTLRKSDVLIQSEEIGVYTNIEQESTISEEDIQTLNGSIMQLDEHHRQALTLVYFNGLTHREAHKEMNVPLGTFKSYIKQALSKLKLMNVQYLLILIFLFYNNK